MRLPVLLSTVCLMTMTLAPAVAQQPREGRCHMDYCSWSRELSRDLVGSSSMGALFRITLLGGSSFHRDGSYSRKSPIKWNPSPHTIYVFCSKFFPAVLQDDGRVSLLELANGGMIPGAQESDFSMYLAICHNIDIAKQGNIRPEAIIKRFGYTADIDRFEELESKIKRPIDILRF